MQDAASQVPSQDSAERPDAKTKLRIVSARDILGPDGVLRIDLDGELYTLRLTRNQRLILTK